jgi:hypothetical protein
MKLEKSGCHVFCSSVLFFTLRTLSVWWCSFRKLHSHHHEIFYRQEQAQALALVPPQKITPLHGKKCASPAVNGVASRTTIPEMKDFF